MARRWLSALAHGSCRAKAGMCRGCGPRERRCAQATRPPRAGEDRVVRSGARLARDIPGLRAGSVRTPASPLRRARASRLLAMRGAVFWLRTRILQSVWRIDRCRSVLQVPRLVPQLRRTAHVSNCRESRRERLNTMHLLDRQRPLSAVVGRNLGIIRARRVPCQRFARGEAAGRRLAASRCACAEARRAQSRAPCARCLRRPCAQSTLGGRDRLRCMEYRAGNNR